MDDSSKALYQTEDSANFQQTGLIGGNVAPTGVKISKDSLDAPIDYHAKDSFRINMENKVIHLYGDAVVNYKEIELKAERIDFYWETGEVEGYGIYDSVSNETIGQPLFKEGSNVFIADHFRYNFKTKKGKSTGMVVKESEGYLHSEEIKAIGDDILYGRKVKYTTCNYEHPHFYIEIDKAKILKDKVIVGKPANLVIEDTRTPLWLPFGFYPVIKERNSGMIQPNLRFNYNETTGFGIEQLGFYWAINDNLGLKTYANVYTHGTHSIYALLDYRKRYRFSGNLDIIYFSRISGERRDPDFAGPSRSLKFLWNLNVDPKKLNNSSFSINANVETSGFNKNIIGDGDNYLNNTLSSSISYSKNWPGKPVRLSLSANMSQNTSSNIINVNAPSFGFNMNTINPFAKIGKTEQHKWWDDIYVTYNMRSELRVRAADSTFFSRETLDDTRAGMKHTASLGTKLRLFKYINITPSFSYNEYWYPDEVVKSFVDTLVEEDGDTLYNQVVEDKRYGFITARDFGMNVNMGYTLYGTFHFEKRKHVTAFRHVMRPSVGFNYRPDFSAGNWGFYNNVQTNIDGSTQHYSRFEDGIYGGPSSTKQMSMNFSLTNDFEMKVRTKRDTTGIDKKIRLLTGGRISASYNFARDSINMSDVSFSSGSTEIYEGIRINFSGSMSPYYTDPATNQTLGTWLVKETGRLFRLKSFRMNVSANFKSKKTTSGSSSGNQGDGVYYEPYYNDPYMGNRYDYVNFSIPWDMRLTYDMNISKRFSNSKDTTILTHSANLNFNFSLTPKWKINTSMRYNFTDMEINSATVGIKRDLHCWYMFMNWSPVGRETVSFGIRVKASQLGILNQLEKSIPNDGSITNFNDFGF
ncbi:MAG: LPS-assembly protein LptD [Bacteroidetes bacterium]|nr:LPS-assembly protein LptD [Bacteroidota bacterium]